jgi:hypothetical protein
MIYRAYITRMVTEHLHVIVDASNRKEAIEKLDNEEWINKWVFETECHNLNLIRVEANGQAFGARLDKYRVPNEKQP